MSVLHFVVGLVLVIAGLLLATRRNVLAPRDRQRSDGRGTVQSPASFLVLGAVLTLAGIVQIIAAFV